MRKRKTRVEESSGNVFADLGLPNPEQELLKARLTLQIYKIVKARGLTQAQAGALFGIKQPHVSALKAQSGRQFLRRPAYRISHRARPGCRNHSEAGAQGARRNVHRTAIARLGLDISAPRCHMAAYPRQQTTEACHAKRSQRRPAVLSRSRVSGGGGYPSETHVRRGDRTVHGDKELSEKLGRNDLCPCGSGRRFQDLLPALRPLRRR
jgi:predicted XRE-type DNA-binding protein